MKISDWAKAHGKNPKDAAEALATVKNLENAPNVNALLGAGDEALLAEFFQLPAAGPKASEADESPLMQMLDSGKAHCELTDAQKAANRHNDELAEKPRKYPLKKYRVTAYTAGMHPLDILACDESEACRVFRRCHDVKDEYRSPNLRAVEIKQTSAA